MDKKLKISYEREKEYNYQDNDYMFMMSTDINLSFKRENCVSTCLNN